MIDLTCAVARARQQPGFVVARVLSSIHWATAMLLEIRGHHHNSLWPKVTVVKEMAWSQPWVNLNKLIMIA